MWVGYGWGVGAHLGLERLDELENRGDVGSGGEANAVVIVSRDESADAVGGVELLDKGSGGRRQQVRATDAHLERMHALLA